MKYQCDTAKECPYDRCRAYRPHPHDPVCGDRTRCPELGILVRCNPIGEPRETHTCYFCDHEGTDVNRIAVVMPPKEYCCDDGIMCDERWQALGTDKEAASLKDKVKQAIYSEVSQPGSVTGITARATANVLRIIELPF